MRRRVIGAGVLALLVVGLLWASMPGVEPVAPAALPELPALEDLPTDAPPAEELVAVEGGVSVECPLVIDRTGMYTDHIPVLVFDDPEATKTRWVAGTVDDAWLRFSAPTAEGAGLVTFRHYERTSVVWWTRDDGEVECHFPQDPEAIPMARYTFDLPRRPSEEVIYGLSICGGTFFIASEGGLRTPPRVVETGVCVVKACTRYGGLERCDDHGEVDFRAGDEPMHLVLDFPDPPAGLAAGIRETEEGLVFSAVVDEKAAWAAGLREGDLLVSVDGLSVDGLSGREAADRIIGPEGEPVRLEVIDDEGVERTIVVEREMAPW